MGFPDGSDSKESDGRVSNTLLKARPGDFRLSLKGSENSLCLQKDSSGVPGLRAVELNFAAPWDFWT